MENLTITEIQARCDALAKAMEEKGVVRPRAEFAVIGNEEPRVYLKDYEGNSFDYKFFRGENLWDDAAACIAALPDPATEGQRKFTRALADAVDIATEYALDDKLVAPVKVAIAQVNEALLGAPK